MKINSFRAGVMVTMSSFCFLTLSPSKGKADNIEPPLPSLLQDVSAVNKSGDICNPTKNDILDGSPKLNQRLLNESPVGSSESNLIDFLTKQGFTMGSACKNDPSIRSASFVQHRAKSGFGLSNLPTYTTLAHINWKVDQANNIVWIKGFVAHDGL